MKIPSFCTNFCTSCGNAMEDGSGLCTACGRAVSAVEPERQWPAAPSPLQPDTHMSAGLDYSVEGNNLQIIRIRLKAGQEIYAEAGKMIYKQTQVGWETRTPTDACPFLTYFRADAAGEIGFAGTCPGKIQAFQLKAGQSVYVQRDSFLVAQSTTRLEIAFAKKAGAGFFGGEGFILEKLTGPGAVFLHAGGDFIEFPLGTGETVQVDTGSIVAFDEGVTYEIKADLFGEGLDLATLKGPGRVIVQSMTLEKMRREVGPYRRGGDT